MKFNYTAIFPHEIINNNNIISEGVQESGRKNEYFINSVNKIKSKSYFVDVLYNRRISPRNLEESYKK